MSDAISNKNRFDLLGNDPEEDSDREPAAPVKATTAPLPRSGKRNEPQAPRRANPEKARTPKPRPGGNEGAFRDRDAGRSANRQKPVDARGDKRHSAHHNEGRDLRGNPVVGDRQPHSSRVDSKKNIAQGWGSEDPKAELKDEQAGEDIAKAEAAEENAEAAFDDEPKVKSYADFLAERANSKTEDLGVKAARQPTTTAEAFANAKAVARDEEDAYIKGKESKAARQRARKEKNLLDVDLRYVEPPRAGGRGDGPRGGRGGRGGRGRGEGRGGPRGGAPRGGAAPRGGRGAAAPAPAVDETNFPSLGSA
ncbi:hypothetical protein KEM56_006699 [Ascosphaera pollenicola]|nr:hypothetical protein KEM56_006699 [Ascosphaera pollenicola]